jgi:hypothetical protein
MECLDIIPNLEMKLGNYTVRDTFYVVDLSDTDVVLGAQWMITLGKITTNYQTLEMGFRDRSEETLIGSLLGPPGRLSAAPRLLFAPLHGLCDPGPRSPPDFLDEVVAFKALVGSLPPLRPDKPPPSLSRNWIRFQKSRSPAQLRGENPSPLLHELWSDSSWACGLHRDK